MKKVAILSMQRINNYGSFLQAYGLKRTIEALGHKVCFVDIRKGEQIDFGLQNIDQGDYKRISNFRKLFRVMDRYFLKRIWIRQVLRQRFFAMLRRMRRLQLGISSKLQTDIPCDTLVIGSDEVFNCVQNTDWGVSYQLFGDYEKAGKIITYAGSCGYSDIKMIPENIRYKLSRALEHIDCISVRDEKSHEFLAMLTHKPIEEHLDPVLISDFSQDRKDFSFKSPYLLVYAYQNRINDPNEIRAIKEFAKVRKLKTLAIGGYQCWCDYNILVEPLQVLDVFKKAEYVITDTFHGAVLSIKENRQFVALVRRSNQNKLCDLLKRTGLLDRQWKSGCDLRNVMDAPICYQSVNKILVKERQRALDYLKENL